MAFSDGRATFPSMSRDAPISRDSFDQQSRHDAFDENVSTTIPTYPYTITLNPSSSQHCQTVTRPTGMPVSTQYDEPSHSSATILNRYHSGELTPDILGRAVYETTDQPVFDPRPPRNRHISKESITRNEAAFGTTMCDLDTLAVLGRLSALLVFVFTLNLTAMPLIPYPFIGNLQDCYPDLIPHVWVSGSVIVAIMFGVMALRKLLFLIILYAMEAESQRDTSLYTFGNNADKYHSNMTNKILHGVDGASYTSRDAICRRDTPEGASGQPCSPEGASGQPCSTPRPNSQIHVDESGDLGLGASQYVTHNVSCDSVNICGYGDLGYTPAIARNEIQIRPASANENNSNRNSNTTPGIASSTVPLHDSAVLSPLADEPLLNDNTHCWKYLLPTLMYHLLFGLWLGWASNAHLLYYTSDLEWLMLGALFFLVGEGVSCSFLYLVVHGSEWPPRWLFQLREGGELLSLLGLALYSLTLPALTFFLLRCILTVAAWCRVIDVRVF